MISESFCDEHDQTYHMFATLCIVLVTVLKQVTHVLEKCSSSSSFFPPLMFLFLWALFVLKKHFLDH